MNDRLKDNLDAIYAAGGDRGALNAAYDEWARDYDADLWSTGNPYIALMAGLCGRYIPDTGARILDGGCGTGNLGQVLTGIGSPMSSV